VRHAFPLFPGQRAWLQLPDGRTVVCEALAQDPEGARCCVAWSDDGLSERTVERLERWRAVPMRPDPAF
jgi:hypothetical protein